MPLPSAPPPLASSPPSGSTEPNRRILLIDDNRSIHNDFRKILCAGAPDDFAAAEALMFGETAPTLEKPTFEIDSAYQGEDGVALHRRAREEGRPYALAFVDVRMPPGIDGIETVARLWALDPDLQVVICTAYSDYSWQEMTAKLGHSDCLLILKKPFDTMEVLQCACALTEKWRLTKKSRCQLEIVTEHVKEATAELRSANEKLREKASLLDLATDAIVVLDLDHHVSYCNKSGERLYGWDAGDVERHTMDEIHRHHAAGLWNAFEKVLQTGEWLGDLPQVGKDGKELIVEGRWTLVRDAAGQPQSILAIHTDVTERKKLEKQSLRKQRMESIGTLAGGIAHDLNNVLTPIMLSIDVLRRRETDQRRIQMLSTIEGSAKRGAEMVAQVLSFAKGMEGEQVQVQIGHLLREVEKIANDTFLKAIQVSCDIPADLWMVQGDPTQLHQVLLNLCVNARDAMPRGGTLKLSACNLRVDEHYAAMNLGAKPGPYVRIDVEDTGTGIPPEVIDRIFEPFYTTKEFGKGTGLGLSTTLAILKSHEGLIHAYSEVGKGARFHVYLPAQTIADSEEAAPEQAEPPCGHGELVLVVDDEENVRQITGLTLQSFGYDVLLASGGADAAACYTARKDDIAVVLTDMMMPSMDGPALIRVLTQINPQVKIIAASGLSSNSAITKETTSSVCCFLPKPYTARGLLQTLQDVLHEDAGQAS